MKKILIFIITIFIVTSCNCKNNEESHEKNIPVKEISSDTAALTSPVNTLNLDEYMFREDVQYVDVRTLDDINQDGYIAGFQFIPFYSLIGSFLPNESLYQMKNVGNIAAGQIGGFVAQYEEAESIINQLFSKNKYIFIVSQAGSESAYLINLLIQLGYDGDLLYNVGGVTGSPGVTAYKDVEGSKYYVSGIGNYQLSISYDLFNELTPIFN